MGGGRWVSRGESNRAIYDGGERTEDDDVQNQDNEANDATTGAILPAIVDAAGGDLLCDGGGKGEGGQAELEEECVDVLIHDAVGAVVVKAQGGNVSTRY